MTVTAAIAPPPPLAGSDAPPAPVAPAAPVSKKLGLSVRVLSASDRAELGLTPGIAGVYVASVTTNSAAELAGVAKSDIITQVGLQKVTTPDEFTKAVSSATPGSSVTVIVTRASHGKVQEIALDLKP